LRELSPASEEEEEDFSEDGLVDEEIPSDGLSEEEDLDDTFHFEEVSEDEYDEEEMDSENEDENDDSFIASEDEESTYRLHLGGQGDGGRGMGGMSLGSGDSIRDMMANMMGVLGSGNVDIVDVGRDSGRPPLEQFSVELTNGGPGGSRGLSGATFIPTNADFGHHLMHDAAGRADLSNEPPPADLSLMIKSTFLAISTLDPDKDVRAVLDWCLLYTDDIMDLSYFADREHSLQLLRSAAGSLLRSSVDSLSPIMQKLASMASTQAGVTAEEAEIDWRNPKHFMNKYMKVPGQKGGGPLHVYQHTERLGCELLELGEGEVGVTPEALWATLICLAEIVESGLTRGGRLAAARYRKRCRREMRRLVKLIPSEGRAGRRRSMSMGDVSHMSFKAKKSSGLAPPSFDNSLNSSTNSSTSNTKRKSVDEWQGQLRRCHSDPESHHPGSGGKKNGAANAGGVNNPRDASFELDLAGRLENVVHARGGGGGGGGGGGMRGASESAEAGQGWGANESRKDRAWGWWVDQAGDDDESDEEDREKDKGRKGSFMRGYGHVDEDEDTDPKYVDESSGDGHYYDCWSLRNSDQFAAVDHLAQALVCPKMRHVVSLVLRQEAPLKPVVPLCTPFDTEERAGGSGVSNTLVETDDEMEDLDQGGKPKRGASISPTPGPVTGRVGFAAGTATASPVSASDGCRVDHLDTLRAVAAGGLPLELYFSRGIKLLQRNLSEIKRLQLYPKRAQEKEKEKEKEDEKEKEGKSSQEKPGKAGEDEKGDRRKRTKVEASSAASPGHADGSTADALPSPSVFVGYHGVRWRVISSSAGDADTAAEAATAEAATAAATTAAAGLDFDGLTLQWIPDKKAESTSAEASAGASEGASEGPSANSNDSDDEPIDATPQSPGSAIAALPEGTALRFSPTSQTFRPTVVVPPARETLSRPAQPPKLESIAVSSIPFPNGLYQSNEVADKPQPNSVTGVTPVKEELFASMISPVRSTADGGARAEGDRGSGRRRETAREAPGTAPRASRDRGARESGDRTGDRSADRTRDRGRDSARRGRAGRDRSRSRSRSRGRAPTERRRERSRDRQRDRSRSRSRGRRRSSRSASTSRDRRHGRRGDRRGRSPNESGSKSKGKKTESASKAKGKDGELQRHPDSAKWTARPAGRPAKKVEGKHKEPAVEQEIMAVEFWDIDGDKVCFELREKANKAGRMPPFTSSHRFSLVKYVNDIFDKDVTDLEHRSQDGDLRDQDGWGAIVPLQYRDAVLRRLHFLAAKCGVHGLPKPWPMWTLGAMTTKRGNASDSGTNSGQDDDNTAAKKQARAERFGSGSSKPQAEFRIGQRVEGNFHGAGVWFPGVIWNANAYGSYGVNYDDGDKERGVTASMIRALADAPKPTGLSGLQMFDPADVSLVSDGASLGEISPKLLVPSNTMRAAALENDAMRRVAASTQLAAFDSLHDQQLVSYFEVAVSAIGEPQPTSRGLRIGLCTRDMDLDGQFPGDLPGSYGWDSLTGELFLGDGYPKAFGAPTWGENGDCVVGCGLLPICKPAAVVEVSNIAWEADLPQLRELLQRMGEEFHSVVFVDGEDEPDATDSAATSAGTKATEAGQEGSGGSAAAGVATESTPGKQEKENPKKRSAEEIEEAVEEGVEEAVEEGVEEAGAGSVSNSGDGSVGSSGAGGSSRASANTEAAAKRLRSSGNSDEKPGDGTSVATASPQDNDVSDEDLALAKEEEEEDKRHGPRTAHVLFFCAADARAATRCFNNRVLFGRKMKAAILPDPGKQVCCSKRLFFTKNGQLAGFGATLYGDQLLLRELFPCFGASVPCTARFSFGNHFNNKPQSSLPSGKAIFSTTSSTTSSSSASSSCSSSASASSSSASSSSLVVDLPPLALPGAPPAPEAPVFTPFRFDYRFFELKRVLWSSSANLAVHFRDRIFGLLIGCYLLCEHTGQLQAHYSPEHLKVSKFDQVANWRHPQGTSTASGVDGGMGWHGPEKMSTAALMEMGIRVDTDAGGGGALDKKGMNGRVSTAGALTSRTPIVGRTRSIAVDGLEANARTGLTRSQSEPSSPREMERLSSMPAMQQSIPLWVQLQTLLCSNSVTINAILQQTPAPLWGSLYFLLAISPKVVHIELKVRWLRYLVGQLAGAPHRRLRMKIKRSNVVADTVQAFDTLLAKRKNGTSIGACFRGLVPEVSFDGEEGVDEGGLTRAWLALFVEGVVDKQGVADSANRKGHRLFRVVDDGTVFLNPLLLLEKPEESLRLARLTGRLLGLAIVIAESAPLRLHHVICRSLTGGGLGTQHFTARDLESVDSYTFNNLVMRLMEGLTKDSLTGRWRLVWAEEENTAGGAEAPGRGAKGQGLENVTAWIERVFGEKDSLRFSVYEGMTEVDLELPPTPEYRGMCGRDVAVTADNKIQYCEALIRYKLFDSIKAPLEQLRKGLLEVVPLRLLRVFDERELQLLVAGSEELNLKQWEANSKYEGYTSTSRQIKWFWRVLNSFSKQQQLDILLFVTARRTVPPGGFANLDPLFQVARGTSDQASLPSAHTCSNQLELPTYSSEEQLRERLVKVLEIGAIGHFGVA
jgi:hypothetical protein